MTRVYIFRATGMDMFTDGVPSDGTRVVKTQPYGCPKNGTMGMCYVNNAETGHFYGLVLIASLNRK
jgi:hypothetical protein